MKFSTVVLRCILFFACVLSLSAEPIPNVQPVISPQKLASSFHYFGDLDVQDITNGHIQDLIFSAPDNSFYRVSITVAKPGSIITPQLQSIINARPTDQEMVTLKDGTQVYIAKNIPIIMMTSKDGRFDLEIGIGPPMENTDIIKNDKNKQMLLEDETGWSSRAKLDTIIADIYNSVAANYDQLAREREAKVSAIMRRFHPGPAPLVSSVPITSQNPTVHVPDVQPAIAPVDQRETGLPLWIYGIVIISMGLIMGVGVLIRSKK